MLTFGQIIDLEPKWVLGILKIEKKGVEGM